jgi:hypothetical protein
MPTYCCQRCFSNDPTMSWKIRQDSQHQGGCNYCNAPSELLLEPALLRSYFEPFLDVYELSTDEGRPLHSWLRSDWGLFRNTPAEAFQQLIADIFDDPSLPERVFKIKTGSGTDPSTRWEGFRESIKHSNRFFVEKPPQLEDALSLLETQDVPERFYRARIQSSEVQYTPPEMNAPPKDICGNGRANPAGIPYLYLASHENVAISEVRPSPGDKVTVASFPRPHRPFSLIDLRQPTIKVSPFSGDHPLQELREHLFLLEKLGRELSTPIVPRLAHLEYLPSQYLCELIKTKGFDGVIYKSSLETEGWNYAIFDPSGFQAMECRTALISSITVSSQPYPNTETTAS